MKMLWVLLIVGLMAPAALAGIDPGTDSFGIYFDTAGNINCAVVGAFQPVPVYLVLMNPSGPTNGFECSVTLTGAPHFILATSFNREFGPEPDGDWPASDFVRAAPSPLTVPANGAVVLVTMQVLLQAQEALLFYIGPSSIPSMPGGLPVLTGNGVLRRGAVASGDVSLPVAGINAGNCPVGRESDAFGTVKSLFR
jgi:hypothetical protein